MTETDAPLTQRQQRMMAYVDDELELAERRSFETELADDDELAAEVAQYRQLMDISRSLPLLEPTDHEIRRFWAHFYNRTEWRVGWLLLGAGAVVLAVYGLVQMLLSQWSWVVKASVISIVAGGGILLGSTVRQKVRTHRMDRYRGVLR